MTVDNRTSIPDAREIRSLWIGLLVPPLACLANLEITYALVPTACSTGNMTPVHLVNLVYLLVAAWAGLVAWRWWDAVGKAWPNAEGGRPARTRFLAGVGVLVSGYFVLVIIGMWIPDFVLHPCQ
jgi:hypothetical protein